ncbi:Glycoside hydrolase, family 25, partial [human gut metagenome]
MYFLARHLNDGVIVDGGFGQAVPVPPATAKAAAPLAKGIDVSKYQGAVNWSAVKNAGYSFAFIKAGSAKSGLDPYYAVNMAGATAAGMKVGVYIYSYATTVEGAMTEA